MLSWSLHVDTQGYVKQAEVLLTDQEKQKISFPQVGTIAMDAPHNEINYQHK